MQIRAAERALSLPTYKKIVRDFVITLVTYFHFTEDTTLI